MQLENVKDAYRICDAGSVAEPRTDITLDFAQKTCDDADGPIVPFHRQSFSDTSSYYGSRNCDNGQGMVRVGGHMGSGRRRYGRLHELLPLAVAGRFQETRRSSLSVGVEVKPIIQV